MAPPALRKPPPPSTIPKSALSKLPHFAGDPPWDPKEASKVLQDTYKEHPHISEEPLT